MKPNKRLAVPDDDDQVESEEELEEEDEQEEEAPVAKKTTKLVRRPVVEDDDEDDEDEAPAKPVSKLKKKGVGKTSSLAKAFASVPLSNNAEEVPTGKHEAIISDFVIQDPGEKGQSARIKFELCEDEFSGKNELTAWYKLLDAELEPNEWGMRAFKTALAKLGYEPESLDEAEEVLDEIKKDRPGVLISVSYQKGYEDFPRIKIEGPCDNEVVEAYKDNVPFDE
jgi:hypothetical protein